MALESGGADSPYRTEHYDRWHTLLRDLLRSVPGPDDDDFTAHALLAATRADLIAYLAGEKEVPREELRARLASFTTAVLDSRARQDRPPRT